MRIATLLLGLLGASGAFGQGQPINQVSGPPPNNTVTKFFYSGTSLIYSCTADAIQPQTTFYKSSSTLVQVVVSSNVGTITFGSTSYLWVGARVTIAGSTTSALNGTYKITAVSGTDATIATSGVSDGTYNNSAMTLATRAPLLNATVWAVQALAYDGSSNLDVVYFAGEPSTVVPRIACSNRASY